MNGKFQELAERFADNEFDGEWDKDELDHAVRLYLSHQGIDEVWADEAYEVIMEHLDTL